MKDIRTILEEQLQKEYRDGFLKSDVSLSAYELAVHMHSECGASKSVNLRKLVIKLAEHIELDCPGEERELALRWEKFFLSSARKMRRIAK